MHSPPESLPDGALPWRVERAVGHNATDHLVHNRNTAKAFCEQDLSSSRRAAALIGALLVLRDLRIGGVPQFIINRCEAKKGASFRFSTATK